MLLAGCSSSNVIGPKTVGDGNIILSDAKNDTIIQSSETNPYVVTNTFTVKVAEDKYISNKFTATIISYTSSCFNVEEIKTLNSAAFKMQATPFAVNNPCIANTLVQTAFTDASGHSRTLWFKLANDVLLAGS